MFDKMTLIAPPKMQMYFTYRQPKEIAANALVRTNNCRADEPRRISA